ncbi:uncharacterized protein LOC122950905 [Acropora millepora]|uniref:uncharacterized protein LOC122950905 n=1 Tax=Acropora millepora TaxID=45264 RepID=UPI001CF216B6|nr:uncharacterized protein LOC122950905 [Acropora millepora]
MLRLTFGVNSSPFLAIATVNAHVNKYAETFPDATRDILNNTYADDCLTGADTDNSALKLQQEIFLAPTESVSSHDPMTKRSLLSLASRMFDPMGLISPFTVRAKILFQELWRRGLEWDDPLDNDSSCWRPFVANRVSEIQSTWVPECWHYCASKNNPADLLTRGLTCENLTSSGLWWNGPQWLSLPLEYQPAQQRSEDIPPEACEEERRVIRVCTAVAVKPFIDMSRYGTWMKLIRVIAYVLKAVKLFKAKSKSTVTELSAKEMQQAELKCCMWVQQDAYKEDYEQLKAGEALPKSSRLLKLDPYYDKTDQVIRVGGWLQFADIPEETKHQIILPHGHTEVARRILDVHKQMLHAGPETVLSTLRQRIWITQGRREVKRIVRKCVICQRQRVGPCGQKMGPLPEERVTPSLPFSDIGIDFAGPLYVKERTIVKKSYVCLFTCASSRMVHLELTNSLTTDEFLQAFSRMTSRRGLCHTVWADNAKAFKAASNEIQRLYSKCETQSQSIGDTLDQNRIESELASKGIKWKFITERPLNQLPDVSQENPEESSKRIMERYLYLQRLFSHYCKRWKQEYLHHLTVRNKWRKEEPPLQVGDIVLVSEDNVSCGKWPLARVRPVRDGLVRTATVRTEKSFLNRPVQRLHRLEIASATPQVIPEDAPLHGGEKLDTVLIVKVFLSLSLSVMLPSPKEDKVGRMLQPVALARVDLVRSRTDLTCNGTPVGTPR